MGSSGLFDFSSGIEFQPEVQARLRAWGHDPANAPAISAAVSKNKGGLIIGTAVAPYQAALDAGVITPQDFQNAVSNPSNINIGPDGTVGIHEGLTKGMGPFALGAAAVTGGGLLGGAAGGAGAAGAGGGEVGGGLASTTIGTGYLPAISGGVGLGGAGGAGAAPSFLKSIGDVGSVLSGAAKGAGEGRFQEAQATNQFNNNQIGAANANLNQQKFLSTVPSTYASQAARGDAQANVQDVSFSGLPSYIHVPTVSGGLRPSVLGPNARAAGQMLSQQALQHLQNPQPYQPVQLTPPPNASGAATAAGLLGTGLSFLGAIRGGK